MKAPKELRRKYPRVDILLMTYNHDKWIDTAVSSIASQDYRGKIRVILSDDCSTDGTRERAIGALHDNKLDYYVVSRRQRIGVTRSYKEAITLIQAPFTAILEGDDYWIAGNKLSTQIECLLENHEIRFCAVNCILLSETSGEIRARTQVKDTLKLASASDLVRDNFIANFSTCVYRSDTLKGLPSRIFELKSYDWIINIAASKNSRFGYIGIPMSVYRIHNLGEWSSLSREQQLIEQLQLLDEYDDVTGRELHSDFEFVRGQLIAEVKKNEYRPDTSEKPRIRSKRIRRLMDAFGL